MFLRASRCHLDKSRSRRLAAETAAILIRMPRTILNRERASVMSHTPRMFRAKHRSRGSANARKLFTTARTNSQDLTDLCGLVFLPRSLPLNDLASLAAVTGDWSTDRPCGWSSPIRPVPSATSAKSGGSSSPGSTTWTCCSLDPCASSGATIVCTSTVSAWTLWTYRAEGKKTDAYRALKKI